MGRSKILTGISRRESEEQVLDFGFRDLKEISEFNSETKPIFDGVTFRKDGSGKYKDSKSLRLRGNELTTLSGIVTTLKLLKFVNHINYQILIGKHLF